MLHKTFKATFVALCLCLPYVVVALPQDAEVVSGNINVQQPDNNSLVIQQSTDKAIINWQQFNIGAGESTRFIVPNSSSLTLNRVLGASVSQILGHLESNGQLWLINPNGIIFGPQAQVNVAGLIASTLNIQDQDFLKGDYQLHQIQGAQLAKIINQGSLVASDHGLIALFAPQVQNSGIIIADLGTIAIGTGNRVTLNIAGNQLLNFSVDQGVAGDFYDQNGNHLAALSNSGRISAEGGTIFLTAKNIDTVLNQSINTSGIIEANTISQQNGKIILSSAGDTLVTGDAQINAKGVNAGENGGEVQILGNRVALTDHASVDVSGPAGGGKVIIGGDYHGADPDIQNAQASYVGSQVNINANATQNGGGGGVVVWADDSTQFYGHITSQGGPQGGAGGFVETSGHNYLDVSGARVNTLAATDAQGGTWLLDPTDITITTSALSGGSFTGGVFTGSANSANIAVDDIYSNLQTNNTVTINNASGASAPGGGNILIQTSIDFSSSAGQPPSLTGTKTLILNAQNQIGLGNGYIISDAANASLTLSLQLNSGLGTTPGTIGFIGNNSITVKGDLTLNQGGTGNLTLPTLSAGGNLNVTANGGNISQAASTTVTAGGTGAFNIASGTGTVTLTNANNDLGTFTSTGSTGGAGTAIQVTDKNALNLGTITANSGSVNFIAGNVSSGDLTQNSGTITMGSGGTLNLVSQNGGFVQNSSAKIVSTSSATIVVNVTNGTITLAGSANNFTPGLTITNTPSSTPLALTISNTGYTSSFPVTITNGGSGQQFSSFSLTAPNLTASLDSFLTTNILGANISTPSTLFDLSLFLAAYTNTLNFGTTLNVPQLHNLSASTA